MVSSLGSFFMAPHKISSCLWLFPFPPYDKFKKPLLPYFFAPPGPTSFMTRQHTQFPLTFVYSLAFRPLAFHEIPTHRGILVQRVFLKFIPLFLVLPFQIIYQYPRSESTQRKLNMTQLLRSLNY